MTTFIGGWEVQEIPKTNYFFISPIRETSKLLGNNNNNDDDDDDDDALFLLCFSFHSYVLFVALIIISHHINHYRT